jgi:hypothetical protein
MDDIIHQSNNTIVVAADPPSEVEAATTTFTNVSEVESLSRHSLYGTQANMNQWLVVSPEWQVPLVVLVRYIHDVDQVIILCS